MGVVVKVRCGEVVSDIIQGAKETARIKNRPSGDSRSYCTLSAVYSRLQYKSIDES